MNRPKKTVKPLDEFMKAKKVIEDFSGLEWTVTEHLFLTHDVEGNPIVNSAGEMLPKAPTHEVTRIRPEILDDLEKYTH